jgi:hypothetical protein
MQEIRAEGGLPRLEKLEITGWCYFSNSLISLRFNICPNLPHINFYTVDLKDECYINMPIWKPLKHINISSNFLLTCTTVKHIVDKCPQIQFLDVSFCYLITGDIINTLTKLRHIEELRMDYQNIGAQCFLSIPVQHPTHSVIRAKHVPIVALVL